MQKRIISLTTVCALLLCLAACGTSSSSSSTSSTAQSSSSASSAETAVLTSSVTGDADLTFADEDWDDSWDSSSATTITLSGTSASISGSGATVSGNSVVIGKAGTYVLTGTYSGQIIVAAENATVKLVLNGVTISCDGSAAIYAMEAEKVIITLADGTTNSLSDTSDISTDAYADEINAALYASTDLTINGSGSLTVTGNYKHAVFSKDDLVVTGGNLTLTAVSDGLHGKDSVRIGGGTITITSGDEAIKSKNTEDAGCGFVYIAGGTLNITSSEDGIQGSAGVYISGGAITVASACDGIQAGTELVIAGGTIDVTSGGGAANSVVTSSAGMAAQFTDTDDSTSESMKGLKADGSITITGGDITVNSADDAVHSNDAVTLSGATLTLASGDDGIHADNTLEIDSGTVTVSQSYEGLEGCNITINDGTVSITASDDGINASDGSSSGTMGMGNANSTPATAMTLTINGGYVLVNASGDGLDSNDSIYVNGGVVLVSGPTDSANGAIDYGDYSSSVAEITGGVVIAVGSSGMAENFTSGSTQCAVMDTLSSTQSAGTRVTLCDSSGNVIVSWVADKAFSNVVISSPALASGQTYTIYTGGTVSTADENGYSSSGTLSGGTQADSITLSSTITSNGSAGTMSGGMGGMSGGTSGMTGRGTMGGQTFSAGGTAA